MRKNRHLGPDGLLKSGLKLIGGKLGQTKESGRLKIYRKEPPNVHTYIEPFLGSANVLVGMRQHPLEICGDLNKSLITFLTCVRDHSEILWNGIQEGVSKMEEGGESYYYWLRENQPEEIVDWSVWFYLITKYGFNGILRFNPKTGLCNTPYCKTTKGRGVYDREWFELVVDRLQEVVLLNEPYEALLRIAGGGVYKDVDPKSTWVVLDPPYRNCKTDYNGLKFSDTDHTKMRDLLAGAKYRWLLTVNDDEFTRELYKDFNMVFHDIHYSCSQTPSGRGKRPELIVTNY